MQARARRERAAGAPRGRASSCACRPVADQDGGACSRRFHVDILATARRLEINYRTYGRSRGSRDQVIISAAKCANIPLVPKLAPGDTLTLIATADQFIPAFSMTTTLPMRISTTSPSLGL